MVELGREHWKFQLPCSARDTYSRLPRTISIQLLNISKKGDSIIFQSNLRAQLAHRSAA